MNTEEITISEARLYNLLKDIGVPLADYGYEYTKDAVEMVLKNRKYIHAMTTRMFPEIAKKHETGAHNVERAIRHSKDNVFRRGQDREKFREIFGESKVMTNGEYIAALVEYLKYENECVEK